MNIKIPERFCIKMENVLLSECNSLFAKYECFATSEMYFFPEYTDHSYKHIQYVLNTADKLISENTMDYLNSIDIFVLCLSILFHDLGMHINFNSLKTLYKQNYYDKLENKEFAELWIEYINEKHLNNTTDLINITDIEDSQYEKYKNVVGQFIRKQHPLIANIIAECGFPDKENFIQYNEKSKFYLYELSGIIARSHGIDLRSVMEYLKNKYGDLWKTPYGCSAVYLMCIVRIADYLHITDDRINKYRLNLFNFENQISKNEYQKHQSVYHSQTIYDNPETIYVEIHPENCRIYVGMLDLLNDIQRELDSSWAILGEVYGKSKLEISVRRITSNILSKNWEDNSTFVSERLKFHYDNRLMDLLIEPLYGKNASYGIRELIQNATDACKMRKVLENQEYEPVVDVIIDNGYFRIIDNGIGMSLKVIKNHFLKIGSSFNNSEEMKELNHGNKEQFGIRRNGKFGIGILSSFLLGDIIEIRTKSKIDECEFYFQTSKNTDIIEIKKNIKETENYSNDSNYGTEIKIKLNNNIDISIIGEWYKLDDVTVNILINGKRLERENLISIQEVENANKNTDEVNTWNILDDCEKYSFDKIYWSYVYKVNQIQFGGRKEEKKSYLKPDLICNGIIIPDTYSKRVNSSIIESWPTLLLYDTKGVLDLNLSRDEINENLPFIKELESVLVKRFAEEFMNLSHERSERKKELLFENGTLRYSKFKIQNYLTQKILYGKKGYSLYNKYFVCKLHPKKVFRIWTYQKMEIQLNNIIKDDIFYILEGNGTHPNLKSEIINYQDNSINSAFLGGVIYLHKQDYQDYQDYAANIYRLSKKFMETTKIKYLEEIDFVEYFGLTLDKDRISLVIEYEYINNMIPLGDIDCLNILSYFNNRVLFPYDGD